MKKRLRKKKHYGEFTESGRQLVIRRNRNTIEFLGIWEHLNNPGFNPLEFEGIKKRAELNLFKVEKGCNEADSGKTVSHIEAEKRMRK